MIYVDYRFHKLSMSEERYDIWEVQNSGKLIYRGGLGSSNPLEYAKYRKILEGPSGLIGKFLLVWNHELEIHNTNDEEIPISLGKFKDKAFFINKIEALKCQKEFLYQQKNDIDQKIQAINDEIAELEKPVQINPIETLLKVFKLGTLENPPTEEEIVTVQAQLNAVLNNPNLVLVKTLNFTEKAFNYFQWKPIENNNSRADYQEYYLNNISNKDNKWNLNRFGRQTAKTELIALSVLLLCDTNLGNVFLPPEILVIAPDWDKIKSIQNRINQFANQAHIPFVVQENKKAHFTRINGHKIIFEQDFYQKLIIKSNEEDFKFYKENIKYVFIDELIYVRDYQSLMNVFQDWENTKFNINYTPSKESSSFLKTLEARDNVRVLYANTLMNPNYTFDTNKDFKEQIPEIYDSEILALL